MKDERIIKFDADEEVPQDKLHKMMEIGRKLDKGKVTLRISPTLCIRVKPENCNEEYAAKYRERMQHVYSK